MFKLSKKNTLVSLVVIIGSNLCANQTDLPTTENIDSEQINHVNDELNIDQTTSNLDVDLNNNANSVNEIVDESAETLNQSSNINPAIPFPNASVERLRQQVEEDFNLSPQERQNANNDEANRFVNINSQVEAQTAVVADGLAEIANYTGDYNATQINDQPAVVDSNEQATTQALIQEENQSWTGTAVNESESIHAQEGQEPIVNHNLSTSDVNYDDLSDAELATRLALPSEYNFDELFKDDEEIEL